MLKKYILCKVIFLLSGISIFLVLGSCCWSSSIRLPYLPSIQTLFDLELRQESRIRIYSLPSCCQPNLSRPRKNEILPYKTKKGILTGLDSMVIDKFSLLKKRSFALLSNSTGRDSRLTQILELMLAAKVRPSLLLEPEHGFYGSMDRKGKRGLRRESRYGLPILSLYSNKPFISRRHLRNIDLILVDIQNLPVRCYTYISTLNYLMQVAESNGIELMILDRPNPYDLWKPQGAYLQSSYKSFVGMAPVPFLYGLTTAEYALYMADLRFHNLYLEIVKVEAYNPKRARVHLARSWVNPSPNIPSLESALVYPGLVFFEGVNYSLGRGTTRPFVYSGAPWLKSKKILKALKALKLSGVSISEISFEPNASHYKAKHNFGIMIIPKTIKFDPLRTGYEYMRLVKKYHPRHFKFLRSKNRIFFIDKLWGGNGYRHAIQSDLSYQDFRKTWESDTKHFRKVIKKYRLY